MLLFVFLVSSHFFTNSGLISIVPCTWFLSAAHRSCTAVPCVPLANWARFLLNRSISNFSSFSFLFSAPGLLFMLFSAFPWLTFACPTSISPSTSSFSRPGSASARDSRLATSFLLGRRRFCTLADDFSILETNEECLVFCLSFFEEAKSE